MAQKFHLRFVWADDAGLERNDSHVIQAENRGEAGRAAKALWRSQEISARPLGFDLLDPIGTPVFQFRNQNQTVA
jgi:hypothetical protein